MKQIALVAASVLALTVFATAADAMSSTPMDQNVRKLFNATPEANSYNPTNNYGGQGSQNNVTGSPYNPYGSVYSNTGQDPYDSGPDRFLNLDPFDPYSVTSPYRYGSPSYYYPNNGAAGDPYASYGGRYSPQIPAGQAPAPGH